MPFRGLEKHLALQTPLTIAFSGGQPGLSIGRKVHNGDTSSHKRLGPAVDLMNLTREGRESTVLPEDGPETGNLA
jgi:hypothetical protein